MEAKPWAADECHSPPVTSRLGSEVIKSLWSSPGIRWIDTDIKGTPYSSSLLQPMLEGQTGLTSKYFNIQIFHLDKQTEKKKKFQKFRKIQAITHRLRQHVLLWWGTTTPREEEVGLLGESTVPFMQNCSVLPPRGYRLPGCYFP